MFKMELPWQKIQMKNMSWSKWLGINIYTIKSIYKIISVVLVITGWKVSEVFQKSTSTSLSDYITTVTFTKSIIHKVKDSLLGNVTLFSIKISNLELRTSGTAINKSLKARMKTERMN